MATKLKFLPPRKDDLLTYGLQVQAVVTADGYDPTKIGWTAEDVTQLGTVLTAAQAVHDRVNAARMEGKAATQAQSAPAGADDQLESLLRYLINKARMSDASDDAVMAVGASRRDPTPTRKNAPADAPEFTLVDVVPGKINTRFREEGSAAPRARKANTRGVLIAIVDGTKPMVDGEAGTVPTKQYPRSPAAVPSNGLPAQVRLYACWVTDRGLTGPWSTPLFVNVA